MKRRHFIVGIGGTVLAGAGAGLYVYRDDLTEFSASPVSVASDVRDDTGYEETGVESVVVEREFEAAGQSENVVVTNYVTEHEKAVDMGPLGRQRGAVFVALSTPQVRVLGEEFNPVAEMTTDELVGMVQDNYEGLENVREDEDGAVTVLDQATTQTRYSAEAAFDGESVDVYVYVTEAVESEDSLVVTIGVYPQLLESQEESNVLELAEGVVDEVPESYEEDSSGEDGNEDGGEDGDTDSETDEDGSEDEDGGTDDTGGDDSDGTDGDDGQNDDSSGSDGTGDDDSSSEDEDDGIGL